jgi:hypothetical protein
MKSYHVAGLSVCGLVLAAIGLLAAGYPAVVHSAQVESFGDQACLGCHTDETRLKELAVEEEVAESPSEGPG